MNLQCIICMDLYTSLDEIIVTPCGHLFHKLCLTNWLQRQLNCAQCRSPCSALNLKRVYLNSVSENEVHLARNCNIETITEELEATKTNLKTVQDDLHNSNSIIMELKTVIASFEDLKLKNIEIERLDQQQLELAIAKYENCEEELKKARTEIEELKISTLEKNEPNSLSVKNFADQNYENITSLKKELELLKLQKQIVDDELKKAKEEIAQMKCVTQALALQSLSTYNLNGYQDPRTRQNEQLITKNESKRNNPNIGLPNSSNQCQYNKSRHPHRSHNKNIRNDNYKAQNRNLNNTKSKEKENVSSATNMKNVDLDEPWW